MAIYTIAATLPSPTKETAGYLRQAFGFARGTIGPALFHAQVAVLSPTCVRAAVAEVVARTEEVALAHGAENQGDLARF